MTREAKKFSDPAFNSNVAHNISPDSSSLDSFQKAIKLTVHICDVFGSKTPPTGLLSCLSYFRVFH
jgi:hypothetical protein